VSWALGVHGSSELDWSARLVRCGCVASFGGLAVGCGGEVWWRALSRYFPGGTYEAGLRFTLDQAVFAPVVLGLAAAAWPLVEGRGVSAARAHVDSDWYHMLGKMWTFWGGASAASYLLAPPQWQPSAAAAAAVLWSAYVSYRLHHPAPEEAEMANASAIDDYLREHRSDRYDVRAGGGDDGPTGSAVDRARDLLSVLSPGR